MISRIIEKNGTYHCSNCLMRIYTLKSNCPFCGNWFSNYEDVVIKDTADKFIDDVASKEIQNENNIS